MASSTATKPPKPRLVQATAAPPALLEQRLQHDPDFVDRVWAYMLATWPQHLQAIPADEVQTVKQRIRQQERGERPYITPAGAAQREQRAQQILELFNGRNAREVARAIGCGRATVYRVLKQHGGQKA